MSIQILPAQLANQIAAGEVVERPASVVKELVENSLDAGATSIKIDIEKGGAKRIRISDNGKGIAKDELTLALSRHATSKIKELTDLEGISSLGFRGEALASISSVARLTLTSKPENQEEAWQAHAQGRDMEVTVQPAAHANGTTIDVIDLFFNTPARRKFMRTEKTEFAHIDEVIKRIALARFDVAFTLTHNSKIVRQYRLADNQNKAAKRIAQVCGQSFIDSAVEIKCEHNGLLLNGWIALPHFYRSQNDLCYSYVNGRMMRDKLINHAIRQAYQELLPSDAYPAFVLFLSLDVREVDVNVHPAKHEVRFHQGRYIHDFIYSTCHRALVDNQPELSTEQNEERVHFQQPQGVEENSSQYQMAGQAEQDYIAPLRSESSANNIQSSRFAPYSTKPSQAAVQNYQQLITPTQSNYLPESQNNTEGGWQFVPPSFALLNEESELRLLSLKQAAEIVNQYKISRQWPQGITSQPLLLPIKVSLSKEQHQFVELYQEQLLKLGIIVQTLTRNTIQIRQFPAILRHRDIASSLMEILDELENKPTSELEDDQCWQRTLSALMSVEEYDQAMTQVIESELTNIFPDKLNRYKALNLVPVDLTSAIAQLESNH